MTPRALRLAAIAGLFAASSAGFAFAQQKPPFDPVGRWRFYHTDGSPFLARLAPDQTAATDWDSGEHGIWRWEGGAIHITYTDGWDDFILPAPDGKFVKRSWEPGADHCGAASNQTPAEHLSTDPGPPFTHK